MKSRMAALVLAATLAAYTVPAMAQNNAPSPTGSNPTAQSVTEQQVLEELGKVKGRGAIPDPKEVVLEQPQGREYQAFHERLLPWIGGILTLGMLIALTVFYLMRGPITLGVQVGRFVMWLWIGGVIMALGKFHGVIAAHTPIGSFRTTMRLSAWCPGMVSP